MKTFKKKTSTYLFLGMCNLPQYFRTIIRKMTQMQTMFQDVLDPIVQQLGMTDLGGLQPGLQEFDTVNSFNFHLIHLVLYDDLINPMFTSDCIVYSASSYGCRWDPWQSLLSLWTTWYCWQGRYQPYYRLQRAEDWLQETSGEEKLSMATIIVIISCHYTKHNCVL
jgi:hypothetical protein